jgi:hypothetical protein
VVSAAWEAAETTAETLREVDEVDADRSNASEDEIGEKSPVAEHLDASEDEIAEGSPVAGHLDASDGPPSEASDTGADFFGQSIALFRIENDDNDETAPESNCESPDASGFPAGRDEAAHVAEIAESGARVEIDFGGEEVPEDDDFLTYRVSHAPISITRSTE